MIAARSHRLASCWMAAFASLPLAVTGTAASAQEDASPVAPLALTGRVVDAAEVVPQEREAAITGVLASLENDLGVEFVVVSTPNLDGMTIGQYARALGNGWRLGDPQRGDGLLLVVAPNERQARIEVGTGLKPILTDDFVAQVVALMVPSFREARYDDGMMIAVVSLDARLRKIAGELAQ